MDFAYRYDETKNIMNMEKETTLLHIKNAFKALTRANEKARQDLINIIKENGGKILTPNSLDRPTLMCYVDYCRDGDIETVPIHGIAFDEGEGLMLLTSDELANYEYDSGYNFEYLYNFNYGGADKENFEKATEDLTYFRPMDDGYTLERETIFSILAGLESYLA